MNYLSVLVTSSLLFINFVSSTDVDCYSNVAIPHNSSILPYSLLNHTSSECLPQYSRMAANEAEPTLCPAGLLNLYVRPIAVFKQDHIPHVQANISIVVHEEVSAVFMRLQCVHAPSEDDVYCHSNVSMIKNGAWTWPCRGVLLTDAVDVPFRYGFSCFRMFSLSQHLVNVTVYPQNCVASILYSIPQETQLFHSIASFYKGENPSLRNKSLSLDFKWSPMISVDMTSSDGIWLRVEGPPEAKVRYYNISLFERTATGIRLHKAFEVYPPHTGAKWTNAENGNYVIYAYVPRHDCHLICESKEKDCELCVHTYLNFTLFDDRRSVAWTIQELIVRPDSAGYFIFSAVFILLAAMVVFGFLYWRRYRTIRRTEEHSLENIPTVLVVYCDDCELHSMAVLRFCKILRSSVRVNVILDQEDLVQQGAIPSRWLIDRMHSAAFVIIVTSPCSASVLEGQKLIKRRPFPDLFAPSVDMIITDVTQNGRSAKSKYAIVRLPYSPKSVPYQIEVLGLRKFNFASEIAQLAAFLHNFKTGRLANLTLDPALMSDFNSSVSGMQNMMERNPDWVQKRIAVETEPDEKDLRIPNQNLAPKSRAELAEDAEKLGLQPPSDSEDEDLHEMNSDKPHTQLLPPSDTESEDSN